MKKEYKQLIAVILLFSFAGLLMVKTIFKKHEPKTGLTSILQEDAEVSGGKEAVSDIAGANMDFFELEDSLKKSRPLLESERDPFWAAAAKSSLRLTGIIYEEGVPVAIINDIIVHEGGEIETGVVVKKIGTSNVVVEKDGKESILELYTQ